MVLLPKGGEHRLKSRIILKHSEKELTVSWNNNDKSSLPKSVSFIDKSINRVVLLPIEHNVQIKPTNWIHNKQHQYGGIYHPHSKSESRKTKEEQHGKNEISHTPYRYIN